MTERAEVEYERSVAKDLIRRRDKQAKY